MTLMRFLVRAGLIVLALGGSERAAPAALVFNFTPTGNAQADAAFAAAGARWSSLFTDNVSININAGFTALGSGIIGSTSSTQNNYSYSSVRNALIADITSPDDIAATIHLQTASSVKLLINRTANSPNGSGSATPYVDNNHNANNQLLYLTSANAKAIGLLPADSTAIDASISFSNQFPFDFDPSDGIMAGHYDFVGAATHEIGHALGFISGVDILDGNSPPQSGPFSDDQFTFVSALDLFRYSSTSVASGAIDWTADSRSKYFSIDGGATSIATFATGVNFGDGRQASHWKVNLGLGIMDPTAATGELLTISANDIRAFDVIGYNLAVPEPSSLILVACGISILACRRCPARRAPAPLN